MSRSWVAGVAFVALSGACGSNPPGVLRGAGSSSGTTSGGGGGASTGMGGASSSGGGGTSTSSSSSSSSGWIDNPNQSGGVTIFSEKGASGTYAGFYTTPNAMKGDCTISIEGSCLVRICTTPDVIGTNPVPQSAGTITITGGKKPLTLIPDAMGNYSSTKDSLPLWDGGEMITVSGAGATVPAFTMTLTAPVAIDITEPLNQGGGTPMALDRSKDFVLTWTNGGPGSFYLTMYDGMFNVTSKHMLACYFPSAPGTGTVPKAALQALPAYAFGYMDFDVAGDQVVLSGGWEIGVSLQTPATWNGYPSGSQVSYKAAN